MAPPTIKVFPQGEFVYFGILKSLLHCHFSVLDIQEICLQINIDGLPLYKSSDVAFWPILG
ncbi:MAG: hypothetical protein LH629_12405, partial [Ignavibacteria bacterium]|nr:hypothetical protein [Ignavibacteria bacterium]